MIFNMWMKSIFALRQTGCYHLLTKKKDKEIDFFELLIFLKTYCYRQSQEILFLR